MAINSGVAFSLLFSIFNAVVALKKIDITLLFATNAQIDVTKILYCVSMAMLYSTVNAFS